MFRILCLLITNPEDFPLVNLEHTNEVSLKAPFGVQPGKENSIARCKYNDGIGVLFFTIPINRKKSIQRGF